MGPGTRRALTIVRTLHVYLSMSALALVLLVSVTGLVMNHAEWFGLDEEGGVLTGTGSLPVSLLERPDEQAIVAELRREFGAAGILDEFEVEDETILVVFKRPGGRTDAFIDRADGAVELTTESGGALAVLADVHRGHHTGAGGSVLVDVAALVLLSVSVTGLVLWASLRRRRLWGAVALGAGAIMLVVFYFLVMP